MAIEDYAINQDTGDVDISEDGEFLTSDGSVRILHQIKSRLKMQRGEWFLDQTAGVQWRELVFVKNPDLGLVRALIGKEIKQVPGVKEVLSVSVVVDKNTRNAQIDFVVKAISGTIKGGV